MTKLSCFAERRERAGLRETKPILMPLACANACIGRPSTAAAGERAAGLISARRRRKLIALHDFSSFI